MSTSSDRTVRKREQILKGAQELFLTRGYAGTSTDAIARTAGVSKETLYAYYANKEELFTAVIQRSLGVLSDEQFAEIEQSMVASPTSMRETLIDLAQKIVRDAMQPDYLALVRMLLGESARFPQLGSLFRTSIPMRGLTYVSQLLDHARQKGLIQVEDVEAASRMFIGSLLISIFIDGLLLPGNVHQPTVEQITSAVTLFCKAVSLETDS